MTSSGWCMKMALPKKCRVPAVLRAAQFWKGNVLGFQGLGTSSCTKEGNSRMCSESVSSLFPQFFQNFIWEFPAVLRVSPLQRVDQSLLNSRSLHSSSSQSQAFSAQFPKRKEHTPPLWRPSFLGLLLDREVTEKTRHDVSHFLGKTWDKGTYSIGLEERIHTIHASDLET